MKRNNVKNLAVLFGLIFWAAIFIPMGCSQHPNPPKATVEVPKGKSPLYGLNPRRHWEYWKIFDEQKINIQGAYFECLAGVPILYTSPAEFEIIPERLKVAWKYCLKKVDKIQEREEDD